MIPSAALALGFWGMHAGRPREVELSGKTKRGRKFHVSEICGETSMAEKYKHGFGHGILR